MSKTVKQVALSLSILLLTAGVVGCSSNESKEQSQGNWGSRVQDKPSLRKDFKFMTDFRSALEENGVPCTDYIKRDEIMVKYA